MRKLHRWLNNIIPDPQTLRERRLLRMFGARVWHPALWHLNRRSVAGGVAAGLFCGLIPGPLQMLGAAIAAVVLRVNLPVALLTTLYTNPFTIVPLYLIAYRLGLLVMPGHAASIPPAPEVSLNLSASFASLTEWAGALGAPLLAGVPLLGALLALCGYFGVRIAWGVYLRLAWRRRARRRG